MANLQTEINSGKQTLNGLALKSPTEQVGLFLFPLAKHQVGPLATGLAAFLVVSHPYTWYNRSGKKKSPASLVTRDFSISSGYTLPWVKGQVCLLCYYISGSSGCQVEPMDNMSL
jgi:hypothetical protein